MEAKRDNRILQRQLDILHEQGNDPKNTYKLKKEVRDQILEDRNKELRDENEAQLLKLREAQTRIKELEKALLSERVTNLVSPKISDEIDQEQTRKIATEIDLMEDEDRKKELLKLVSHLHSQKLQILALKKEVAENADKKSSIFEISQNALAQIKNEIPSSVEGLKLQPDYEKKLVQVKENMIQRLCTYFYNDFLDAIDESLESNKHSALIFQLKMADRKVDLSCIVHAHIQNYKE